MRTTTRTIRISSSARCIFNPECEAIGAANRVKIQRADRFALRIKDAHSPSLQQFHGLNWYAPDVAYRVTAKWIPYTPQKTVSLLTLVGTSYPAPVPGAAEFTLQGK